MPQAHPLPPMQAGFAGAVAEASGQLRNIANEPELKAWIEELGMEKLGEEAERDERQNQAWKWLSTVGRKAAMRDGSLSDYRLGSMADEPAWIAKALSEGKSVHALALADAEREKLASAVDWLVGAAGPALGSDWSKVSLAQALEAEAKWVARMGKEAMLAKNDAMVAEGTVDVEGLAELSSVASLGDSWRGWKWVRLANAESLAREGALMGHCVGSYAWSVQSGRTRIYSLRDPNGKPAATVEARGLDFCQLKAPFNAPVDKERSRAATALIRWAVAENGASGVSSLKLGRDFKLCSIKRSFVVGCHDQEAGLDEGQRLALAEWKKGRSPDGDVWREALAEAVEGSMRALALALMPALGASPAWLDQDFKGLASALENADEELASMLLDRAELDRSKAGPLVAALRGGSPALIRRVASLVDPACEGRAALKEAARSKRTEAFKELLGACEAPALDAVEGKPGDSVEFAIGSSGLVELAEAYEPFFARGSAHAMLLGAARGGGVAMIGWLASRVDSPEAVQEALEEVARFDSPKALAALLKFADPLAGNSAALAAAADAGAMKTLGALIPLSKVDEDGRGVSAIAAAAKARQWEAVDALAEAMAPGFQSMPAEVFSRLAVVEYFGPWAPVLPAATEEPAPPRLALLAKLARMVESPAALASCAIDVARVDPSWVHEKDEGEPRRLGRPRGSNRDRAGEEALASKLWAEALRRAQEAGRDLGVEALAPSMRSAAAAGGRDGLFEALGGSWADMRAAGVGYDEAVGAAAWGMARVFARAAIVDPTAKIDSRALIRAADSAPLELVADLAQICDPKEQGSKALLMAVRVGRLDAVRLLLPLSDAKAGQSDALRVAASRGEMDMVELLLPHSDPKAQDSAAVREAARFGRWEAVSRLWPLSDPNGGGCEALCLAIAARQSDMVEMMLPSCEVSEGESAPLRAAAKAGDLDLAKRLLADSNPRDAQSEALRVAVARQDVAMTELLAPLSDVDARYSEAVKKAVGDAELEIVQAILPYADPEKGAKIIKAAGFEDDAEEMLLAMLPQGKASRPAP